MIPEIRKRFNEEFTEEKYAAFLQDIHQLYPGQLDFRVAETPIFVPAEFRDQILSACEAIIDTVHSPDYQHKSERAIPDHLKVPGQDSHPHFIAFDFGICTDGKGGLEPQLIEMQAFPTIFAWQLKLGEAYQRHFNIPGHLSPFINGFDRDSYADLLRRIILGKEDPRHVILLEVFPEQQKTRVDFHATEELLGIRTVCLTRLIQEGRDLYYDRDGEKTKIHRIYNRLIFDDLFQQPAEVQEKGKLFQEELNVSWVPHPNWFYRWSKFTLPFIQHPYVPFTRFLSEVEELPQDLDQYVVKPLFSFAGQGVIIDVKPEDIRAISDPENWILQRKVEYANAIETPGEPAKAEIRIFYFWEEGAPRPIAANNLARLSKGKMVGVRYNKDKEWVGGTQCFFEQANAQG